MNEVMPSIPNKITKRVSAKEFLTIVKHRRNKIKSSKIIPAKLGSKKLSGTIVVEFK